MSVDIDELPKLNLGCGLHAPEGWINIDVSFSARLSKMPLVYKVLCGFFKKDTIPWPRNIKIMDIRKGLPFPDNSVGNIFSSHVLEHMVFSDADFVIKECYRCLCRGGIVRLIVPDLYQIAKKYVELMTLEPKSEHSEVFLKSLNMQEPRYKGLVKVIYGVFGHSRHLHMFDEWSLKELLEKHGFNDIKRMSYGQSRIKNIEVVEDRERHEMSVCLEGVK